MSAPHRISRVLRDCLETRETSGAAIGLQRMHLWVHRTDEPYLSRCTPAALREPGTTRPRLVGGDDQLGAVAQAELGEDAAHMRLRGGGLTHEPVRDLCVRQPRGDEQEHLGLALGQRRQEVVRGRPAVGLRANSRTSRVVTVGASGPRRRRRPGGRARSPRASRP